MLKVLAVALAVLLVVWAPPAFAGHGGGELLRAERIAGR